MNQMLMSRAFSGVLPGVITFWNVDYLRLVKVVVDYPLPLHKVGHRHKHTCIHLHLEIESLIAQK